MRFILFATSLIGFATAMPGLRNNNKDDLEDQKNPISTLQECEQLYNALDLDGSGAISLEDVEIVSENLTQDKIAELTDALGQMLYATGVTSIQDDFSLSHADYMFFCMNADDMEAAKAKRAELMKKKTEIEKRVEMKEHVTMEMQVATESKELTPKNYENGNQLQASCRAACPSGQYCGSGGCRPNGSCAVVEDCFNPDNTFPVSACVGTMQCSNSGQCTMNCGSTPSGNNDRCENAHLLVDGQFHSGSISRTNAGSFQQSCGSATSFSTGTAWYRVQASRAEEVAASTCWGTSFDSQISVFRGNCNSLQCVTGNNDQPGCGEFGQQSYATWRANAGEQFYIVVHGHGTRVGDYTLQYNP